MAEPDEPRIRPGHIDDAASINRIYNHFVNRTTVTFDIEPWPLEQRQAWVDGFASPYFLLVAEQAGRVTGFAHNGRFRPKAAYDSSTDVTVYTAPGEARPGTGSALYRALFSQLQSTGLHRAYAIIALPNDASVRLHEKFGFRHVGTLHEAGTKFDRRIDVAWFEKPLD